MVAKFHLLLLVPLLSVSVNGDGTSYNEPETEWDAPNRNRIQRPGTTKANNRDKMTGIVVTKNTQTNGRMNSNIIGRNTDESQAAQSTRRKRNAYDLLMRYILRSASRHPTGQTANSDETDMYPARKSSQEIIYNPLLQKMMLRNNDKRNDYYTPILHTLRGKRAYSVDSGRYNQILRIPFGKRTSKKSTQLKRDLSAAYGNFGGPFGKRGSAETSDSESSSIEGLSLSEKIVKLCQYLSKLNISLEKCNNIMKMVDQS